MKKKYLTLKELERLDACGEARDAFKLKFGKRARLKDVVKWTHNIPNESWEGWLLWQTLPLAKAAIENGVDIHVDSDEALVNLIQKNKANLLPLVKFLVGRGIWVNAGDCGALFKALLNTRYDVADFLLKNGARLQEYMVYHLVRYGNIKATRLLFASKGAKEHLPPVAKLLETAVRNNKAKMVSLIYEYFGEDVSASDRDSCFKYAVNNGDFKTAEVFRNYGAYIE